MSLGPLTSATDFNELVDAFEEEIRARATKLGWAEGTLITAMATTVGRAIGARADDEADLILGMENAQCS